MVLLPLTDNLVSCFYFMAYLKFMLSKSIFKFSLLVLFVRLDDNYIQLFFIGQHNCVQLKFKNI